MASKQNFIARFLVMGLLLISVGPVSASRKATDMMSQALKQRAAGNFTQAISYFRQAIESTGNSMQINLASFMLGDCQLEAGRYADARQTFKRLSETVKSDEELAEALYCLMRAESALGNKKTAQSIFDRIKRGHRSSPYYSLAQSFMKADGLKSESVNIARAVADKPANKEAAPEVEEKPTAIARPLIEEKADEKKPTSVVRTPAEKKPAEKKPEKKPEVKKTEPEKTSRPVTPQKPAEKSNLVKVDARTTELLRKTLHVNKLSGAARDNLVTVILGLQDQLKDGPEKTGMDQVLLSLAETTVKFGELLEACKTYDQILTHHPASPLVEKAYFEAIRLRAVLGVHDAVIGWSKAFLAAFPASEYRAQIRALVEYSRAGGKVDIGPVYEVAAASNTGGPGSGNSEKNDLLKASSEYQEAARKMKDGRYNLALVDFKRISRKHPDAPIIWWDTALVYVQLEDFQKARMAINRMLSLDPDNEEANSLSGYINYRLENFSEAADAYERAGEPQGSGVNFFDAKTASERMKKSAGSR